MATSHARSKTDSNRSACGACKDPRMLTDDGRYDCGRCARIEGRKPLTVQRVHDLIEQARPAAEELGHRLAPPGLRLSPPEPALGPAPAPDAPCVPATSYRTGEGTWIAECPFLGVIKHGRDADEAEGRLRDHVRSLGPAAKAMLRRNQRFFQLPLPE